MKKYQHYLYLSSKNSLDVHPENSAFDFINELPTVLELEGRWDVALIELSTDFKPQGDIAILCDLCEPSLIKESWQPLLRKVPVKGKRFNRTYVLPYYTDVSHFTLKRVRVYIRDVNLNHFAVNEGSFECTLHLRRVS